ncbi:hypothetical protein VMCG_06296 [Cytospora schulzeri]|uniref:Uncharacterized protein n=1 Tax=Cytospora schulzeri TaxID=448051 RepID=A0A423W812_9PEZI|nr:hypothetical protein VMCG_06296 [Valsa malicola]
MAPAPIILSPALPSELLTYIIQQETYPTTLIICSSRAEFLTHLISDVQDKPTRPPHPESDQNALISSPLYQVAIARHIRMVFVPTVAHLRAHLSVFTNEDSKVPPPPPPPPAPPPAHAARGQPLLLVYGFLDLHRDTSEWSAQGVSSTAASLVEAARRTGFRAVVVNHPRRPPVRSEGGGVGAEDGGGNERAGAEEWLLAEEVTVLSASARKVGADLDDAAWTGRKVTLGRVLGRWFRYGKGDWDMKARDSI